MAFGSAALFLGLHRAVLLLLVAALRRAGSLVLPPLAVRGFLLVSTRAVLFLVTALVGSIRAVLIFVTAGLVGYIRAVIILVTAVLAW